jgi:hypothetical protein
MLIVAYNIDFGIVGLHLHVVYQSKPLLKSGTHPLVNSPNETLVRLQTSVYRSCSAWMQHREQRNHEAGVARRLGRVTRDQTSIALAVAAIRISCTTLFT